MTPKPKYQIKGLSKGQPHGVFFSFDLRGGGKIRIPPDQVMRLWNKEQELEAMTAYLMATVRRKKERRACLMAVGQGSFGGGI